MYNLLTTQDNEKDILQAHNIHSIDGSRPNLSQLTSFEDEWL
jgi:hypothetical protein